MRFIELTLLSGEDARSATSVAVAYIVRTQDDGDNCLIRLTNGEEIRVFETYDIVANLMMDSGVTYK